MKKISIIVPVYNVESYLNRCVDSILNQSYSNLEIILVDDGSSDNSGKLCDEFKAQDDRVIVIHKKNGGLGFARNTGLELATGSFVTFVDGDDYIGKDHILNMVTLIAETGSDTCMCGYTKQYAHSKEEHQHVLKDRIVIKDAIREILPRMCGTDEAGGDHIQMSVCMVLFSLEIIHKHSLRFVSEREFISEDLVFDFSYYPWSNGVCIAQQCSYFYCDNEGSLTTKYRSDRFEAQVRLYDHIMEISERLHIQNLSKPRLDSTLIAIARYSIKIEYKFEKKNGKELARVNVQRICENKTLQQVLNQYDGRKIKISSRLVNLLIKKRMYILIRHTMHFKNIFGI